jgi:hypothetical protein
MNNSPILGCLPDDQRPATLRSEIVINVIEQKRMRDYAVSMLATSPNNSQKSVRQRERRWNPRTVIATCAVCSRSFGSKAEADQHMNSAHRGEILRIFQRGLDTTKVRTVQ